MKSFGQVCTCMTLYTHEFQIKNLVLEDGCDFTVFSAARSVMEWSVDVFVAGSISQDFAKTKELNNAAQKYYEMIFNDQSTVIS